MTKDEMIKLLDIVCQSDDPRQTLQDNAFAEVQDTCFHAHRFEFASAPDQDMADERYEDLVAYIQRQAWRYGLEADAADTLNRSPAIPV